MVADELKMQGARPWAALVLTQFAQSNPSNWTGRFNLEYHFDGLVQDCSNSSALAIELLQSYNKPSIYLRNLLCKTCNF